MRSDSVRKTNTKIMGIAEGEERKKKQRKTLDPRIKEANGISNYLNPKGLPMHIVFKLSKINDNQFSRQLRKRKR